MERENSHIDFWYSFTLLIPKHSYLWRSMKSIFRFKQFEINQQGSPMKINTDGVLLGAMALVNEQPRRILDIGTGTGLIAMMLAQRFPNALIEAVEIDGIAARCAQQNFQNSPFASRLQSIRGSFEEIDQTDYYDWIVSNPPFYTNSLPNPNQRKGTAKHTDIFFFQRLLHFAESALTAEGELHLILPTVLAEEISLRAKKLGFSPSQIISIRSYPNSKIIRKIIGIRKNCTKVAIETDFNIYDLPQQHSAAYRAVLEPFFLAF